MLNWEMVIWIIAGLAVVLILFGGALWLVIKQRNMQYWLKEHFFPKPEQARKRQQLKQLRQRHSKGNKSTSEAF